jgi:hypothetical protein
MFLHSTCCAIMTCHSIEPAWFNFVDVMMQWALSYPFPPWNGPTLWILWWMNVIQGPQRRAWLLGTSLASRTLACNLRLRIFKPPLAISRTIEVHLTLEPASLSTSYPKDSVYNQLSDLLKWFELVRSLQEHKYHMDAKMTWLTTKILPTKANFLPPHSNKNFFIWLWNCFPPLLKWNNQMESPSN